MSSHGPLVLSDLRADCDWTVNYRGQIVIIVSVTSPPGKPIADAGRDVIIQPGQTVTLNGIESLALGDAHITSYQWRAQRTEHEVQLEVSPGVVLCHLPAVCCNCTQCMCI